MKTNAIHEKKEQRLILFVRNYCATNAGYDRQKSN